MASGDIVFETDVSTGHALISSSIDAIDTFKTYFTFTLGSGSVSGPLGLSEAVFKLLHTRSQTGTPPREVSPFSDPNKKYKITVTEV